MVERISPNGLVKSYVELHKRNGREPVASAFVLNAFEQRGVISGFRESLRICQRFLSKRDIFIPRLQPVLVAAIWGGGAWTAIGQILTDNPDFISPIEGLVLRFADQGGKAYLPFFSGNAHDQIDAHSWFGSDQDYSKEAVNW